jgi:hypothetical protein
VEILYLSEAHLILTTLTQYLQYAGNLRIADADSLHDTDRRRG